MSFSKFFCLLGAGILPALLSCAPSPRSQARVASISQVQEAIRPKGKPLVVNHWATWCQPCVEELPRLAKAAEKYAGRADFLGISWDSLTEDQEAAKVESKVRGLSEKMGVPYDSLIAEGSVEALGEALRLESLVIPQTFVFGRDGKVIRAFESIGTEDDLRELEKAIDLALKQPQ